MKRITDYPPTYWAATVHTATPTALNGTKVIGYLWKPAASSAHMQICRIEIHGHQGLNGYYNIELLRVTAEAETPGGTTPAIQQSDASDAASVSKVVSVPTGAPTLAASAFYVHLADANTNQDVEIEPPGEGKPLYIPAGSAGGFAVRVTITDALTSAADVNAAFVWMEIPVGWTAYD